MNESNRAKTTNQFKTHFLFKDATLSLDNNVK